MAESDDERRRYFRIEDTIGLAYQHLTNSEALVREEELKRVDYSAPNRVHVVERQLQMAIDKLRVQSPDIAAAIDLLNIKVNSLKDDLKGDGTMSQNLSEMKKVSISACGVSFDSEDKMAVGAKLDMDLKLVPTDLHVFTLGEVVSVEDSTDAGCLVSVDFYGMTTEDEELLVQHVVKRQGKLLGASRGDG
ncbi:MAG: PilZ domain-containing protein [Pseudomonadales bacterium]|nr:PilZ domain-containing protein [Pseudomonadales bacterium]